MNNELSKTIGIRINTLLGEQEKKQKDLAAYLRVTDNTISYFVSGKRMPNTEQIVNIAKFFDTSTDYLLGLSTVSTNDKGLQFVCDYLGLSESSVRCIKTAKFISQKGKLEGLEIVLEQLFKGKFFTSLYIDVGVYAESIVCMNEATNRKHDTKEEELNNAYAAQEYLVNSQAACYRLQSLVIDLCNDCAEIALKSQKERDTNGNNPQT